VRCNIAGTCPAPIPPPRGIRASACALVESTPEGRRRAARATVCCGVDAALDAAARGLACAERVLTPWLDRDFTLCLTVASRFA
jgi:hypothetical protein